MNPKLQQAIAYRTNQDYEQARTLFQELLADTPDDALINYHFAWLHDTMGLEHEAIPYYETAIANGLPDAELRGALLGLGSTYRTIGRYEDAVTTLKRGMMHFPQAMEFPVFLAMALYNTAQHKEAVQLLLKTLLSTTANEDIQAFQEAIALYAENLDQTW